MFHIHQAGIQHSDFAERNIVIGTGEDGEHIPIIIDFGKAQSHQCTVQWDQVQLDRLTPTQAEFQCSEMRDVCEETDVWASESLARLSLPCNADDYPATINWYGQHVPVTPTLNRDSLIEKWGCPENMSKEDAFEYVKWRFDLAKEYEEHRRKKNGAA